jgi:hypothetical protein
MIVAGFELTRMLRTPSSRIGLARLCAGVVELGRLADDDRARANDQDAGRFQTLPPWLVRRRSGQRRPSRRVFGMQSGAFIPRLPPPASAEQPGEAAAYRAKRKDEQQ